MESMHTLVELEGIDFAKLPTLGLAAKLTQSLAQVALMRNPRPFSNLAFDAFRDFLHFLYRPFWLTSAMSRGAHDCTGADGSIAGLDRSLYGLR
jgi:hypothetical protein